MVEHIPQAVVVAVLVQLAQLPEAVAVLVVLVYHTVLPERLHTMLAVAAELV
jgi:hypothetical protein